MAEEPKRELILQDLETTLTAIDGEGPYWTEVKTVKRVPLVPTEFEGEDKPALLIVATGEPEEIENQMSYHDKRDLRVGIIGVMDRPIWLCSTRKKHNCSGRYRQKSLFRGIRFPGNKKASIRNGNIIICSEKIFARGEKG